jgi:hypothetical protein
VTALEGGPLALKGGGSPLAIKGFESHAALQCLLSKKDLWHEKDDLDDL